MVLFSFLREQDRKHLCASSGHNLMYNTENGVSSFCFMARTSDAPRVTFWFQKLGYEIDHETCHIT